MLYASAMAVGAMEHHVSHRVNLAGQGATGRSFESKGATCMACRPRVQRHWWLHLAMTGRRKTAAMQRQAGLALPCGLKRRRMLSSSSRPQKAVSIDDYLLSPYSIQNAFFSPLAFSLTPSHSHPQPHPITTLLIQHVRHPGLNRGPGGQECAQGAQPKRNARAGQHSSN